MTSLVRHALVVSALLLPLHVPDETHSSQPPTEFLRSAPADVYEDNGTPTPVQLITHETKLNLHTGSNVARQFVYAGSARTFEVSGPTASFQVTNTSPVFYLHLNQNFDPETASRGIVLLSLEPGKDGRVVATFTANAFGGGRKRHVQDVEVTKTLGPISGWLTMTPVTPLTPGEYAIAAMPSDVSRGPANVWDFNVPGVRPTSDTKP